MLCVRTELAEIMVNQVLLNKSVGNGGTSEQTQVNTLCYLLKTHGNDFMG